MTADAWITGVVIIGVLVTLARELAPPPIVLVGALTVLMLADVLEPGDALAGFANPAPVTVAALYVVARAVQRAGGVSTLVALALGSGSGPRGLLVRMMLPVTVLSAVMNNTPIVAVMAPAVSRWAEANRVSASRVLMPLSYAAILGGTLTAIGTSTTLVVSGLLEQQGLPPLGLLEPLPLALPAVIAGLLVTIGLAPRLLADRRQPHQFFRSGGKAFALAVSVAEGGPIDGRSVIDAGLRALDGVFCVQVRRGQSTIAPVAPDLLLQGGDELTFVGDVQHVVDLQQRRGLVSTEARHAEGLGGSSQRFYEAVVGPSSPLIGSTLKAAGFRGRYDAAVVAIHRAGAPVAEKLGTVVLRTGDTLLCLADETFAPRAQESGAFVLVADVKAAPALDPRRARLAVGVLAGMLVLAGTGALSILEAALAAAVLLVVTRVLTAAEARQAVDASVILVIGGAFALGAAMQQSGLAGSIAEQVVALAQPAGVIGLAIAVVLMVVVLTELITNNAAAVLALPIVQELALGAGRDVRVAAIAVGIAASLSFITPLGYQTNLMVYGLGGYRFGDFARLGTPVSLASSTALVLTMHAMW